MTPPFVSVTATPSLRETVSSIDTLRNFFTQSTVIEIGVYIYWLSEGGRLLYVIKRFKSSRVISVLRLSQRRHTPLSTCTN